MADSKQRKLNNNQIHILKLIYKFRFVTPGLLAEYRGVRKWTIQNGLNILVSYGLVTRRYDKSYKMDRKPASYHLTSKAIKLLRDEHGMDKQVLHARYKDHFVGQGFIDHSLNTLKLYLDIRAKHPDEFKIFTKYEIHGLMHFPDPKPDLYLKRKNPHPTKPTKIMIDLIPDNQQNWVTKKRIDDLLQHYEDEEWPNGRYPAIMLYVNSSRTADTLNTHIEKRKDDLFIEDMELLFQVVAMQG